MNISQFDYCTNRLVVGINKDNFKVLVDTVLVNPVRVEHPKISTAPSNTFLRRTPQASLVLEVVHTLSYRLTVGSTYQSFCSIHPRDLGRGFKRTLGDGLFPVTTTNSNTVHHISLFRLVS